MKKILSLPGLLLLGFLAFPLSAQDGGFQVVVHASSEVSALPEIRVSRLFLKKITRWENGRRVIPVDQAEQSEVRRVFSEKVHGKDMAEVKRYWQTVIFSGRARPPRALRSDQEVLDFVAANPDAIGYVSAAVEVDGDVKLLKVEE